MEKRPTFQQLVTSGHQYLLPLPLPPAPRIKADQCRYCHGIHMNVTDFIACRESNT